MKVMNIVGARHLFMKVHSIFRSIEQRNLELVGCNPDRIAEAASRTRPSESQPLLYGDGHAAKCIVQCLADARTGNLKRSLPWSA